jgi:hypothetical protein
MLEATVHTAPVRQEGREIAGDDGLGEPVLGVQNRPHRLRDGSVGGHPVVQPGTCVPGPSRGGGTPAPLRTRALPQLLEDRCRKQLGIGGDHPVDATVRVHVRPVRVDEHLR